MEDTDKKQTLDEKHLSHTKLLWFIHKVQSYGFWALILLGCGVCLGIKYSNIENVKSLEGSIKVGSFLFKGTVYEVIPRTLSATSPTETTSTSEKTSSKK